ncbi:MAG TPA: hypothetical protein VF603_14690 [Allosphingosinicella sp.]|jgi:hypothetical protein
MPKRTSRQRKTDVPGPERDRSILAGKNKRPQVRARRNAGWTKKARRIFLDHLAATCNVTASAAAAGLHWSGAYALRRRDPEFAEQWRAALETGYARLEAMLMQRAARDGDDDDWDDGGDPDLPPPDPAGMDTELALQLLRMHRAPLSGSQRRLASKPRSASKKELVAALLKQLRVLRRRLEGEGA